MGACVDVSLEIFGLVVAWRMANNLCVDIGLDIRSEGLDFLLCRNCVNFCVWYHRYELQLGAALPLKKTPIFL